MEFNLVVPLTIKVSTTGRINKATMVKVARILKDTRKNGTFFVTDASNSVTCWEVERVNGRLIVDCEMVNDEIDHYNRLEVWKFGSRFDFQYPDYESYSV